jgi:ADP-ribose pyrophosphatase YjhB (NUDIX family)
MEQEQDTVGAGAQWLAHKDWLFIQDRVPILCIDVLLSPEDDPRQVGLIRRAAPDGDAWCLIGGRVLRNERLSAAVERHVAATLGTAVHVDRSTLELGAVIEYFTERGATGFYDPRKHAVALTYAASCECTGEPEALGEAFEFAWFKIDQLSEVSFGFGQGEAVARVLKKLGRI